MRKPALLPLFPLLVLLALLGAGATAPAALSVEPPQRVVSIGPEEEETEAEGSEADEIEGEEEGCEPEEEDLCEEEADKPAHGPENQGKAGGEAEAGCPLKSAVAAVSVNPGKRRLRLTVRYRTWKPVTVSVAASLDGAAGATFLGSSHSRFQRSGVYRDTFALSEKEKRKALGASVAVVLQVVNAPAECRVELTAAPHRAR